MRLTNKQQLGIITENITKIIRLKWMYIANWDTNRIIANSLTVFEEPNFLIMEVDSNRNMARENTVAMSMSELV